MKLAAVGPRPSRRAASAIARTHRSVSAASNFSGQPWASQALRATDEPSSCLLGTVASIQDPRDAEMLQMAQAAREHGTRFPRVGQLVVRHGRKRGTKANVRNNDRCYGQRPCRPRCAITYTVGACEPAALAPRRRRS
jgi:hypothetical protein